STMGYLREGLPEDDPRRREKLHGAAQRLMILAGGAADPEKMAGELKDKNRKTVVKAIMSLAGIPVQEIDETTLKVSDIKVSKKQIETLVSGKL
ncbi:MAG: hypothetical protein II563_01085, partial [Treponema sp.]|nr:hypothetical protein [Treponema sp.]